MNRVEWKQFILHCFPHLIVCFIIIIIIQPLILHWAPNARDYFENHVSSCATVIEITTKIKLIIIKWMFSTEIISRTENF